MLERMQRFGTDVKFVCDHTGLRVKKTVDGVDALYTYNGKKLTHLRKENTQIHFFYDAQGRPSIVRQNGIDYAYMHNLQGDIIGIVDMGGKVVVEYAYDAWGKPIATMGSMAGTLGYDNPFRYRGYVYDEETGLYYLRSRYYNPEWGRFLNADTFLGRIGFLLSQNAYLYCKNNPINKADPDGLDPTILIYGMPPTSDSPGISSPFDESGGFSCSLDPIIISGWIPIDGLLYRYRIDPGMNPDNPHVHVQGPDGKEWKQRLDGTPYEPHHRNTKKGDPPRWIRDIMKDGGKGGKGDPWDWDENAKKQENKGGKSSNSGKGPIAITVGILIGLLWLAKTGDPSKLKLAF